MMEYLKFINNNISAIKKQHKSRVSIVYNIVSSDCPQLLIFSSLTIFFFNLDYCTRLPRIIIFINTN